MRSHLRLAAVVGAVTLGALAAAPAMAATDNQAGANAVYISVAGNGQGSGTVTASYSNGKETTTGNSQPAFPDPTGQKFITGGVLAQEATAKPGFSAACAGLAGDGGSVLNIGNSSCLTPGNLVSGSLGSLDIKSLLSADPAGALAALPDDLKTALAGVPGGAAAVTTQINQALTLAQKQFGDGSLTADLDLIEGRCTAGDGGPTGTSTLTNAKLAASFGGQSITLLDFPTHPAPNTHLITDLSKVLTLVLEGVRTDLQNSLQGQAAPLQAVIDQIENNVVTHIHDQVEANLKPLEDNVLDITLNQQVHPTRDSIKVRALDVQVLPAAKSQLGGSSLVNLQVGNAACAPVARVAVSAPQPQAAPPHKALPTAVSAGLASAPGQSAPQSDNHVALAALAMMLAGGTALVAIRWLRA